MKTNSCLFCYKELDNNTDFHEKCSKSFFGQNKAPNIPYTLDEMTLLAKEVIERSVTVPGVQPKLSMSMIAKELGTSTGRLTVMGALGGEFILKPPSADFIEMPQNEHLTMRIAEGFGITVVPSSLVRLASGELAYLTKRIDRTQHGEKIHMLDMFQITEAYDKYKSSMEKVGKAINAYSANTLLDKINYFEIVLFSFLTGNNDMHLKNFSMIESSVGWILAPAYDLLNVNLVFPEDKEELALTLQGKKKKLKRQHFVKFGRDLGMNEKQIKSTFKRMEKRQGLAVSLINKSYLSKEQKFLYLEILIAKYKQLDLLHKVD